MASYFHHYLDQRPAASVECEGCATKTAAESWADRRICRTCRNGCSGCATEKCAGCGFFFHVGCIAADHVVAGQKRQFCESCDAECRADDADADVAKETLFDAVELAAAAQAAGLTPSQLIMARMAKRFPGCSLTLGPLDVAQLQQNPPYATERTATIHFEL